LSDWIAWQVVDSAFPTGAFAHSWGLESAWQHGEVDGLDDLRVYLEAAVLQTGYGVVPLLNDAYRSPGRLPALDASAEAFLVNTVANRASRVQGRALAATAARVWPRDEVVRIRQAAESICAHVAPISGAIFGAIGLPLPTAQRVALYGTARGVLAAAVRLGIAGSYEAQRLQYGALGWLDHVACRCRDLTAEDLAQTAPVADLLQGAHDRLYSRLFQS
jgi:urease accessory protein